MPSPTTPPVWRRAFLRALSQGAPVNMAAAYAGICRRQPYSLRRKDPLFAKLWATAQQRGRKARQSGKTLYHLTPMPRLLTIRQRCNGKTAIGNAGEGQWNDEKELAFLTHLAATANVTASAEAAGISKTSLYARRRKWPAFRGAWDEAKSDAVDRLDFLLIEAATNLLDPPEVPTPDLVPVTFDQALQVVQNYARATNKRGEPKRWRRKPVDVEALKAEILRKIEVIDVAGGLNAHLAYRLTEDEG